MRRPGMTALAGRSARITILTRDGMFVTPPGGPHGESRRVGPLSQFVRTLAARPPAAGALLGGVFEEARSYAHQLAEARFCLEELLPLLRSFGRGLAPCGEDLPRISCPEFEALERRALELLRRLGKPLASHDSLGSAPAWLGVPCAIVSNAVVPLARVMGDTPPARCVTVRGVRYALREERSRPLRDLLLEMRREARRCAERYLEAQPGLGRMAAEFVVDAKSILPACHPGDGQEHRVFHRDRDHQLQHCRGHWMLVRGPVARRTGRGNLFVGLPIKGATRASRLTVVPRPSPSLEGLWTPRGEPAQGRFCMGALDQYRRLFSSEFFSDAEAVVQWLDAGVILATGRSAFHQQWRQLGAARLADLARSS